MNNDAEKNQTTEKVKKFVDKKFERNSSSLIVENKYSQSKLKNKNFSNHQNQTIGRNLVSKNKDADEINEKNNSLSLSSTQSLDQIYMKLKMQELNEDFERRQKMLNLDKKITNVEAENAELNVYRKIITISISLIVTGLLMGILLGLILVMYLNSKK